MAAGKTDVRQNKNKPQDAKNATVEAPVEKKSRIIFLLKLGVALLLVILLILLGFGVIKNYFFIMEEKWSIK